MIKEILDYSYKEKSRNQSAKGKTSCALTENKTLFLKQESSAPVSDYYAS